MTHDKKNTDTQVDAHLTNTLPITYDNLQHADLIKLLQELRGEAGTEATQCDIIEEIARRKKKTMEAGV